MGLFQLSFTVLLCYHSPCILRFRGRTLCSVKSFHLLTHELNPVKFPSEYLRSIQCIFLYRIQRVLLTRACRSPLQSTLSTVFYGS